MGEREITLQSLGPTFRRFGGYVNLLDLKANPEAIVSEQPGRVSVSDLIQVYLGTSNMASLSACKMEPMALVLTKLEYHKGTTQEGILCWKDTILCVGPPTRDNEPPLFQVEAYLIPGGTYVVLNAGVWHYLPFVRTTATVLFWLPPRISSTDGSYKLELPPGKLIRIVVPAEFGPWP